MESSIVTRCEKDKMKRDAMPLHTKRVEWSKKYWSAQNKDSLSRLSHPGSLAFSAETTASEVGICSRRPSGERDKFHA